MRGPLEHVTVVDLTAALSGPYATLLLAGLGATVIKVEHPERADTVRNSPPYLGSSGPRLDRSDDDAMSVGFMNRARNKLSVTLDLKHPRGKEVFADLVRKADVVMENFSSGTADRLGVGWAAARQVNPRIVYCSLSGFGADGDPGGGKAYDAIIQALSGVMMTSGNPGDPPIQVGFPLADLTAPLFAVIGILAALEHVRVSGRGQHVDVSMLGALTSLVACEPFNVREACGIPTRTGNSVPRLAPFGIFPTNDGWVAICASDNHMFAELAGAMGRAELPTDHRFVDRNARATNYRALDALIEEWSGTQALADVVAVLQQRGVPVAPVRTPQEAVRDERVLARGESTLLSHPALGQTRDVYGPGVPVRFSESEVGFDQPAPLLGEHNQLVYEHLLGYSADDVESLRKDRVL